MFILIVVFVFVSSILPSIGVVLGLKANSRWVSDLSIDQQASLTRVLRKVGLPILGIVLAGVIQLGATIGGYPNPVSPEEVVFAVGAGILIFGVIGAVVVAMKSTDKTEGLVLGALVGSIYGSVSVVSGLVFFAGVAAHPA